MSWGTVRPFASTVVDVSALLATYRVPFLMRGCRTCVATLAACCVIYTYTWRSPALDGIIFIHILAVWRGCEK